MSDETLVERLTAYRPYCLPDGEPFGPKVCTEAAARIRSLEAQLAEAREAERTAVVAWLRDGCGWGHHINRRLLNDAADAIERGDHLTRKPDHV